MKGESQVEKKPLVTVITPTYRKFDKIYETIQSVLEQDYPRIEFILSDDASEAFPKEEIEQFILSKKKGNLENMVIRQNGENLGTVRHLNVICKMAEGEYIVNLAGDDLFFDTTVLSRIVERFETESAGVIVTSRVACTDKLQPLYFLPRYHERRQIEKLNTPHKQYVAFMTEQFFDMASGSAVAFRNDVLKKYDYYDEQFRLWEDVPFFTKYTWKEQIVFAYDIVAILYRLGGVSNNNSRANPLMRNDRITYNRQLRCEHADELNWFVRDNIQYINKRYVLEKKSDIMKLYFRYPIVMVYKIIYKIKRIYFAKKDKSVFEKFIDEHSQDNAVLRR